MQPTAVEGDSFEGLPALFGGVQSVNATQNPGFAGAHHAFVWYCSSDCHMGERSAGPRAYRSTVMLPWEAGAPSQCGSDDSILLSGLGADLYMHRAASH